MSDEYGIYAEIGADDSGFQAAFNRVDQSLQEWGFSFDTLYARGSDFFKGFGIDLDTFAGKLGTTGPMLAAGIGVAVTAFTALKSVINDTTKEFREDETAQLKFYAAIDASSSMTEGAKTRLEEMATAYARLTGEEESAIQSQMAMVIATGRNEEQTVKLMDAALALSNATGTDLRIAIQQLNMTFSGSTGRLARMTPEVASLTKEELQNGAAVDLMNKKYGAFRDILSGSTDVSMKNFDNGINEIKSTMGEWFEGYIKPIRDVLTSIINYLVDHKEIIIGIMDGIALGIGAILFAINPVLGGIELLITGLNMLQRATGGWQGLWLETQKVALLVVKAILDGFSVLVNGVTDAINTVFNAYNGVAEKLKMNPIKLIDHTDIANAAGVTTALAGIEAQIVANRIANEKLGTKAKEIGRVQITTAKSVSDADAKYAKEAENAKIASLERAKNERIDKAEEEKASIEDISRIQEEFDAKILASYVARVEGERKVALQKATEEKASAEAVANINYTFDQQITEFKAKQLDDRKAYHKQYSDAIAKEEEEREKKIAEDARIAAELASKYEESALQATIDRLTRERDERANRLTEAKGDAEDLYAIELEYDDRILALYTDMINKQRQADIAKVANIEDNAKIIEDINATYDSKISQFHNDQIAQRFAHQTEYTSDLKKEQDQRSADAINAAKVEVEASKTAEEADKNRLKTFKDNHATAIAILEKQKSTHTVVSDSLRRVWQSAYEDIEKSAKTWDDTMASIGKTITDFVGKSLTDLGEDLVLQEKPWKNLGKTALYALSDILDAIGKQLTALAVVHAVALDAVGAVAAGAGATAAFVASGVVKGLADKYAALGSEYTEDGRYIVGEQGPEILDIPQGSKIYNANETRTLLNQGERNITFAPVFNSPKAMNRYEQLRELRKLMKSAAFKGVL